MTRPLEQILTDRAARADTDIDPDDILEVVRDRAARRARQRRNLAAVGTGGVLVAALTVGLTVLTPGSDSARPRPDAPAGGGSTTQSTSPAVRSGLVPIAPAPSSAEVSIGLVPAGWVLLSSRGPVTLYGPPSLTGTSSSDFEGKLVVSVSERYERSGRYPLIIAGRRGSYFAKTSPDTYQGVDVIVDATTEVNFQLPDSVDLPRADVLRLADTLDIRSTKEKTHG